MRLGADPEVFLAISNSKLVSAIGKVGGTKKEPLQLTNLPSGFTVQEDNVAMEFGIPPASSKLAFIQNIKAVLEVGLAHINTNDSKNQLKFSKLSCAVFPKTELTDPRALVFGCEPDFNAWTGEANESPLASNPALRSAGGHIHVETKEDPVLMVKAMDLFIGIPSIMIDKGKERKQLYGKAGAFRYKPYGLEYRTPSNFWIFNDKLVGWVWDSCKQADHFVKEGRSLASFSNRIQKAINNDDKKEAEFILNRFQILLP